MRNADCGVGNIQKYNQGMAQNACLRQRIQASAGKHSGKRKAPAYAEAPAGRQSSKQNSSP